jgi:hypothetical protein
MQRIGPYFLLEALLPGGTLFALLLYLYKRRQARAAGTTPLRASEWALARVRWGATSLARRFDLGSRVAARGGEWDGLEPLDMLRAR